MFRNKVSTKGEGKSLALDAQGQALDKHWSAWQGLQIHPGVPSPDSCWKGLLHHLRALQKVSHESSTQLKYSSVCWQKEGQSTLVFPLQ